MPLRKFFDGYFCERVTFGTVLFGKKKMFQILLLKIKQNKVEEDLCESISDRS